MDTLNGHSRCLLCGTLNPRSLELAFEAGDNDMARAEAKFMQRLEKS
jgi:hypothetical protein